MVSKYLFENEQRTIAEIHAIIPCITKHTIRRHIERGLTTRKQMLDFQPESPAVTGRRGRQASPYALDMSKPMQGAYKKKRAW